MSNRLQEISSRFFYGPGNGLFYYLTRHGRFLELNRVNVWCLCNYKKALQQAGGEDLPLFKALSEEIEARRSRGEIPPIEEVSSGER